MTSGLLDSLADPAHQGTPNNLTPGPDHLEEGKELSVVYVSMDCFIRITLLAYRPYCLEIHTILFKGADDHSSFI